MSLSKESSSLFYLTIKTKLQPRLLQCHFVEGDNDGLTTAQCYQQERPWMALHQHDHILGPSPLQPPPPPPHLTFLHLFLLLIISTIVIFFLFFASTAIIVVLLFNVIIPSRLVQCSSSEVNVGPSFSYSLAWGFLIFLKGVIGRTARRIHGSVFCFERERGG